MTIETRRDEIGRAVFGGFDGSSSTVGLLAGLYVAHASPATVLATAGGLAVAAAVGMGFGDYLGSSNVRLAVVMAVATFLGSLIPALPVALVGGTLGYVLAALLVVALGVTIAEVRATERGRFSAYLHTGAVLVAASALSGGAAVGLGAVG